MYLLPPLSGRWVQKWLPSGTLCRAIIALMIEIVSISETSVYINETTRRSIPETSHIHTRRRKNLKSHHPFTVWMVGRHQFMVSWLQTATAYNKYGKRQPFPTWVSLHRAVPPFFLYGQQFHLHKNVYTINDRPPTWRVPGAFMNFTGRSVKLAAQSDLAPKLRIRGNIPYLQTCLWHGS
jgi:hypothetical protein